MRPEISHERCSELLPGFLRGDLAGGDEEAIRTHLAGCEDCRAELAGLTVLTAEIPEGLREDERVRLHDGVAAALAPRPGRAGDVIPLERRTRAPWGARWLGAAAAVLVIAVGGVWAVTQFGGVEGERGTADSGAGGGAGAEEGAPAQDIDGPTPLFAEGRADLEAASRKSLDDQNALTAEGATEFSRVADSPRSLGRLVRTSPLVGAFAAAYEPAQADDLADAFIAELVKQAPPGFASQIEECGPVALEATDSPILPVFAVSARYLGDEALILAFITGDVAFDHYSVVVWPAGSCERPLDSVGGPLRG
jgi:hypothetical protein